MPNIKDTMMLAKADIVIDLNKDGTYVVIKDRHTNFKPRDERVYGVYVDSKDVEIRGKNV